MRRCCLALLAALVAVTAARAHFIWILPGATEPATVRIVFSENAAPDNPALLDKIAHANLFVLGGGKPVDLMMTKGEQALEAAVAGTGPRAVAAVCRYGVLQRGQAAPFLLNYYAKTCVASSGDAAKTSAELPLEIVPQSERTFRVLWQGKPLAGAEVVVIGDGDDGEAVNLKADAAGAVTVSDEQRKQLKAAKLFGVRARHVEAKEGQLDGKAYKEVRHYTTLTLPVARAGVAEADPAATQLLAEARAARAAWKDFPGFVADVEVNRDGQVSRGQVQVSAKGKVELKLDDAEAAQVVRRDVASLVAHRLENSAARNTPCAFADNNAHHPLGRAVRVLNDELHSSYRIRDRQIIEVNRQMQDHRFTITVLENHLNDERQFLPQCFTVNSWDLKTGQLRSSQTFHHAWKRVGAYDLPATLTVVEANGKDGGKLTAQSLKFANHKMTP